MAEANGVDMDGGMDDMINAGSLQEEDLAGMEETGGGNFVEGEVDFAVPAPQPPVSLENEPLMLWRAKNNEELLTKSREEYDARAALAATAKEFLEKHRFERFAHLETTQAKNREEDEVIRAEIAKDLEEEKKDASWKTICKMIDFKVDHPKDVSRIKSCYMKIREQAAVQA